MPDTTPTPTPAITSSSIQMDVRILLYAGCGALLNYGIIKSSWVEPIVAVGGFVATRLWTAYGNRLRARIEDLASYAEVGKVELKDQRMAIDIPSSKVVATPQK